MGYSNNYSGNHVDVSKMTTEEKKAYYEEQRKRQEELVYHSYVLHPSHWTLIITIAHH